MTMPETSMKLAEAIKKYQEGSTSAWKCAREAQVSLRDFLDELRKRGIGFKTDEDELKSHLTELV